MANQKERFGSVKESRQIYDLMVSLRVANMKKDMSTTVVNVFVADRYRLLWQPVKMFTYCSTYFSLD